MWGFCSCSHPTDGAHKKTYKHIVKSSRECSLFFWGPVNINNIYRIQLKTGILKNHSFCERLGTSITHTHTHTHTLRCWLLPEVLGSEPDFAVSITFTNETSTFFFILFFQKKLHTEKFILFRAIAAVRKLNERAKYTLWSPSFDVNIIRRLHYELRDTSAVSVTQKLRRDKKKHTKFRNTTS